MQNLDRFSLQAREALRQAQAEAARLHHSEVTPEHIAVALGSNQRAMSLAILRDLNVPVARMQNQLREAVGRGSLKVNRAAELSDRFQRVLDLAVSEAKVFGDREIGTQHLLLGVIREGGDAKSVLAYYGVSLYGVHRLMRGLGFHDGDQLPAVDLNQSPIMKSAAARAVRSLPIRPSVVFLGLIGFFALMGALTFVTGTGASVNQLVSKPLVILFVLSGWVVIVCLHEFGHAAIAFLGGDSTVVNKGYLTLNPLKYTHRLLSIIMPILFLLLGAIPLPGGAVYIDRSMIRDRRMLSLMSAGGILMQLAALVAMIIPYLLLIGWLGAAHTVFWAAYSFLMYLNILGMVINLLPIPGIDGFGIIAPFLPDRWLQQAYKVMPYGVFILFAILWLPNPIRDAIFALVRGVALLAGIDFYLVGLGSGYFHLL